jgi:hypothetical protein
MKRRALASAGLLGMVAVGLLDPAQAESQAPTGTRTVFVTATGDRQRPVTDLTAADFVVKEDGQAREVVEAARATTPLNVALLVDDNGYGLQSIREGVLAFVRRLSGLGEFSITTTSGRNLRQTDYTGSQATLFAVINRLRAREQSAGYMLDVLLDTASDMTRREFQRNVIVAITTEGEEWGTTRPEPVLDAIQRSRAQVYLINLGTPVVGRMYPMSANRGESNVDDAGRRNNVFGVAPARSGGRVEQVVSNSGIPTMMLTLADELAAQYAVTFRSGSTNGKLSVEVRRRGVDVRAPQW